MKLRTTLIVLLLGLLAAFAIWRLGPDRRKTVTRPPLVPPELLERWDELELKLYSDEQMKLVREPGAILLHFGQDPKVDAPFAYQDPADLDRVDSLLNALRQSSREPLEGDADDLLRLGLDPPRCRVKVRAQGRELDLGFGIDDPAGGGVIARSIGEKGEKQVFRTSAAVMSVLKGGNQDQWRTRTVFGFDPLAVTEIDITRFDPKDPDKNRVIVVEREGGLRNWRLKPQRSPSTPKDAEPRSLMADAQACQNLAQQLTVLRVQGFVSQSWTDLVTKLTGLPDKPFLNITVGAGPATLVLDVGSYVPNQGYAAVLHQRDENCCFTLRKEDVEPLIALTADDMRPHRLFPRIEALLVRLIKSSPDGKAQWAFGRQADSPRGKWEIRAPFQALAHEGKGAGSFAQAVVDLDRVEVAEFLDPATPFTPQATLELGVKNDQIVMPYVLEVARVNDKTLVRVVKPPRPDELFAVSGKLAELLDLDPELYRDRMVFPRADDYGRRVIRWRLEPANGPAIEVFKANLNSTPEPATGTANELVPRLTAAASTLFGNAASGYVRLKNVPGDPFAKPVLRLTLETPDGKETLVVGSEGDAGFYCRVTPRMPDDVLMIVPRAALQDLFTLIPR